MIKSQPGALLSVSAAVVSATVLGTLQLLGSAGTSSAPGSGENGSGKESNPPPKSLTVGRVDVVGLAPGKAIVKQLAIGNPNNQPVVLQAVQTLVSGPTPTPKSGSCTSPTDFEVIVAGYNASTGMGPPFTIAKNSTVDVPVTVRMNNSSTRNQNACKSRSWSFTFTATATSK